MRPAPAPADPREQVRTELERVARRWQQLPLDRALPASAGVVGLVQCLADEVAAAQGLPRAMVPELGPGVVIDQLRVLVHDHARAGLDPQVLAQRLSELRRSLP